MSEDTGIRFALEGGVATVTIDRPQRMNAIDSAAERALDEIWRRVEADREVRCVVLTGAGDRAFSAGADMKEKSAGGLAYWSNASEGGFGAISMRRDLSVPLIGRINGMALGGGFEMALGCDILIAAETATFSLPEPRVGRIPLDGMITLPRRMSRARAMEILLTGKRLTAPEALDWGLVNEVVPAGELDAAVARWTSAITEAAPLSLRAIKETVATTSGMDEWAARRTLGSWLAVALQSEDSSEGVAAFLEKRKPVWKGR